MSRNLSRVDCEYCNSAVAMLELPRPISESDAGKYHGLYRGMLVAHAWCAVCEAKYLAWCSCPPCWGSLGHHVTVDPRIGFFDLSFRSTFNDEPGPDDLPTYDIQWLPVRTPRGSVNV